VVVGSAALVWASSELGRHFDYWRGALGLLVMLIMVLSPTGMLGLIQKWKRA
jgi:branched-chain amino acid transport system permease protein